MTFLTLLALGTLHGLQPDHAAAAISLGARSGTPAWKAALKLAGGHALAFVVMALLVSQAPSSLIGALEPWTDRVAGASLAGLGAILLFQFIRARYVVHAHEHDHGQSHHEHLHAHPVGKTLRHEHGHARGAIALGLVLGLSGARSLLVLLPSMSGAGTGIAAIALYCSGIAIAVVAAAGLADLVRRLVQPARGRWIDLASGVGAIAAGVGLLV